MLTGKDLYARIDDIVERAYLGFAFMLVGQDLLTDEQKRQVEALGLIIGVKPLIELLYILVRNRPTEGYAKDATLNRLINQIAATGLLPIVNDAQQATLDVAKTAMMDAVESTKQELKKQLRQQVIEVNREHRQHVAVKRIENVSQVTERKDTLKSKLLKLLPGIMMATHDSFERSFSSALTDTVNDVAVDAATADSLFTGEPPGKTTVFKKVVDDGSLCRWCRKFYANEDGTPVLYTLEELQANGSNYGKPKSEWKPVLGKTHPRCRCQLFHRSSS